MGDGDEVDLEHRVDRFHVLLLEQAARHQPGVVDEQVDRRELGGERVGARVGLPAVGQIEAAPAAPRRTPATGSNSSGRRVPASTSCKRPRGERLAERAADATVGAGD